MKQWKLDERCKARNYSDPHERESFEWGYSDGWHGKPKKYNREIRFYPNAYSAGYWEGYADIEYQSNLCSNCGYRWPTSIGTRCLRCGFTCT